MAEAHIKVLFVCSGNRDRSKTAEHIYAKYPHIAVKSAGTASHANTPVSATLLSWADVVCVMEPFHEDYIREQYAGVLKGKFIFCLNIPAWQRVPEDYHYMAPPLVDLIREKMEPIVALLERLPLLQEDIAHVQSVLERVDAYDAYDFAADLKKHMEIQGLSASELAKRLFIKHTAVGKWLNGVSLPNGKERMKEAGMALGMGEDELSDFLLKNQYTRLSSKNPLDATCKRLLRTQGGSRDIVQGYRLDLLRHGSSSIPLPCNRVSITSSFLSEGLQATQSEADFISWLETHADHFDANDKMVLPSHDLQNFILLYVGHQSVNTLYRVEDMPDSVRRLLYSIRGGREYTLRGLREKLIVLGLYIGMTDEDIDQMLRLARLLPLTKQAEEANTTPHSIKRTDAALVTLMRRAHERCPLYEYTATQQVIDNIVGIMASRALRGEAPLPQYDELKREYLERFRTLRDPYDVSISADDEQFEDWYADHLSHYAKDMLYLLTCGGTLKKSETAPYRELISKVVPEL